MASRSSGTRSGAALSFWESREVADAHRVARMQFRDRLTSAVGVEVVETTGFELTFAQLRPRNAGLG